MDSASHVVGPLFFSETTSENEARECLVKNSLHNRKVTVYVCLIFS